MNLIPFFAVALCFVATCGGEDDVKNGKTRAASQDVDLVKQLAELNAKLTAREKENEELKKEIIKQNVELDQLRQIKIQIQVQANATGDTRKLCQSEIEKYLAHNSSDGQGKNIDLGMEDHLSCKGWTPIETMPPEYADRNGNGNANGIAGADPFRKSRGGFATDPGQFFMKGPGGRLGCTRDKDCLTPFPFHVWFEFKEWHIPAKFQFTRMGDDDKSWMDWDGSHYDDTPKTWKFIGSADENCNQTSNWIELCGDSEGCDLQKGADVRCVVPTYARKPFRCLGIRILSDNNNHARNEVCMKKLRFWEVL